MIGVVAVFSFVIVMVVVVIIVIVVFECDVVNIIKRSSNEHEEAVEGKLL